MIAIIDYGAGNLSSVAKAVTWLGYHPVVTSDSTVVRQCQTLILPGVGAVGDAMAQLKSLRMTDPILEAVKGGVPFLGICLGLQVLLTESEESGGQKCLGVVPGTVKHLPLRQKVPHMGWNRVRQQLDHPLFRDIPDRAYFYFVHSYYVLPRDNGVIAGETEYGTSFCSMIIRDNVVATQFHPEKSGEQGLKLLGNFLKFAAADVGNRLD
jgi:glutamine amidotransferase